MQRVECRLVGVGGRGNRRTVGRRCRRLSLPLLGLDLDGFLVGGDLGPYTGLKPFEGRYSERRSEGF